MMHLIRACGRPVQTILAWAALALFITACSDQSLATATPFAPVTEVAKAAMTATTGPHQSLARPVSLRPSPACVSSGAASSMKQPTCHRPLQLQQRVRQSLRHLSSCHFFSWTL
jgi:hypothetical protein